MFINSITKLFWFEPRSNDKVFFVLDCFDTDKTLDPFSLMISFKVIIQLVHTRELKPTLCALVSRGKEDYFRLPSERHRLLGNC